MNRLRAASATVNGRNNLSTRLHATFGTPMTVFTARITRHHFRSGSPRRNCPDNRWSRVTGGAGRSSVAGLPASVRPSPLRVPVGVLPYFKFIPPSSCTAISALQPRWSLLTATSLFGTAHSGKLSIQCGDCFGSGLPGCTCGGFRSGRHQGAARSLVAPVARISEPRSNPVAFSPYLSGTSELNTVIK